MSDCTCTNCIFIGDGKRYCYDCEQWTTAPNSEELEDKIELVRKKQMNKEFATYSTHYNGQQAEGHIYLDKEGACTITLTPALTMPQHELDRYGEIMAKALNRELGTINDDSHYNSYTNHLPRLMKEIEDRAIIRDSKDKTYSKKMQEELEPIEGDEDE